MKFVTSFYLAAATIFPLAVASCSMGGSDSDDHPPMVKPDSQNAVGVTLDDATQTRIGLKIELPAATQWQPEMKTYGVVIDPSELAAAMADLKSAQSAASLSERELARQKKLAAENNASARALENAQAAAEHDRFVLESTQAKFKANWGANLSTNGGLILSQMDAGQISLARIDLPTGENGLSFNSARLILSTDETNAADARFFDKLSGVDPQTQSRQILFLTQNPLPPNSAITAFLKTSDKSVSGVTIPAAAILYYEGKGWVYEQTGTNQFARVEIPLTAPTSDGWFVPENTADNLSATNQIVTRGAGTILSAELSGGFDANNRN